MGKVSIYYLVWGLAVIALLLGGLYMWSPQSERELSKTAETDGSPSPSTSTDTSLSSDATPDITVAFEVPDAPIPNLDRTVNFQSGLSSAVQDILTRNINNYTASLKKDPYQFNEWVKLGVELKIAGDYHWARDAWEYASALAPDNFVSFSNLGDLYHYYLKDYPAAEKNILQAIENNKTSAASYAALHELYKYSYTEKADRADDVLLQGLATLPKNIDLLAALGSYYLEQGDTENAKKYLGEAKEEAEKAGDTARAALFESELKNL